MQITKSGLKKPECQDIEPIQSNIEMLDEHLLDTDIHVNAAKIAEIELPEALSPIDDTDTNSTMWGKIKKSIDEITNHEGKVASETVLGHIKIGSGLQMTDDVASVKIANDLSTKDAETALSAAMGAEINEKLIEHEGKVASETVLGHIKIGSGLQITGDVASVKIANDLSTKDAETALSAAMGAEINEKLIEHEGKVASETVLGHIKIGSGLQMTDDVANVKIANDLSTRDAQTALSATMGAEINEKLIDHEEKVASETVLGHIKIGSGLQMTDDVASIKIANDLNTTDAQTALSAAMGEELNKSKAPINHASTSSEFGLGDTINFGHVKLSDNYTTSAGTASEGLGASSKAIADAYNTLNNTVTNLRDNLSSRGVILPQLWENMQKDPLNIGLEDGLYGLYSGLPGTINLPISPFIGYFEIRRFNSDWINVVATDLNSRNIYVNDYFPTGDGAHTWTGWKKTLTNDKCLINPYKITGTVNVPSGVETSLCSYNLEPGRYVVTHNAQFATNGSGQRMVVGYVGEASAGRTRVGAASGHTLNIQFVDVIDIATTTMLTTKAYQTSGTTLQVTGEMTFFGIANA